MKTWGIIAGLSAASIWGGMYVVSKVLLEVIPPFSLLTIRLILGILALWIFVYKMEGTGFSRQDFYKVLGVGWIGYGISVGLQFVGTKLSTASVGSLVTSATPAFVLVFAYWLLGEKISARHIFALLVSSVGVLAIINPKLSNISSNQFIGNLCLMGAAITWALYSVLIRKVTRRLGTLPVSMIAFIGGLFITIPASLWELNTKNFGEFTGEVFAGLLFLGIVSTALAMYLWNTAFSTLEAGIASLTIFAQPVVGVTLGTMLLGEKFPPMFFYGGVLIAIGLVIAAGGQNH